MKVWQKSKDLAVQIYRLTNEDKFDKDFGLKNQIRRASVSVPSNIAECDELDTNKQSIRHFYIAKGSIAEVITQIVIAFEIGYLDENTKAQLIKDYDYVSIMLQKLIKARTPKT